MRTVVTLPALALLLVGCASGPTTAADAPSKAAPSGSAQRTTETAATPVSNELPEGFTRFEAKRDPFSIALPKGFAALDPNDPNVKSAMEIGLKANPQMGRQLQQLIRSSPFAFQAFDFDEIRAKKSFVANVNIVRQPGGEMRTFDETALGQLEQGITGAIPSARVVNKEVVKINGQDALFLVTSVPTRSVDGKQTDARSELYMVKGKDAAYTVTFTAADDKRSADFRRAVETLREK